MCIMCVCLSMCVPHECVCSWSQKRAPDSLELESQVVVSHPDVGAGNQTWIFFKNKFSYTEPSLQLHVIVKEKN